jgi:peptide/nickel transport system permease protein
MLLLAQGVPVSQDVMDVMRSQAGLDKPFFVQYATWLLRFVGGDMGISYVDRRPVAEIIAAAMPRTLVLTLSSITITVALSIPLGILAAVRQDRPTDYILRFLSFLGNGIPNFLLSLILIYVVALKLGWLPVLASDTSAGLLLPSVALSLPMTGKYIRQVRAAVLEQLSMEYVRGALARGIKPWVILYKDVLKNAMLTISTLLSLSVGSLLGGTAAIERIFVWQGMGFIAIEAISQRDYPVIQAFVVWMSVIYVMINLIADLSYYLLDPRTRQGLGMNKR